MMESADYNMNTGTSVTYVMVRTSISGVLITHFIQSNITIIIEEFLIILKSNNVIPTDYLVY